jgi:hypothetical protein
MFFTGCMQWVFKRTSLWYNDVIQCISMIIVPTWLRSEFLKERDIDITT